MRVIQKPWGYEEIWTETDKYVGKMIVINPHHRLSLQFHQQKMESIRILSGILYFHLQLPGEELQVIELTVGQTKDIPPGTIHRFEAREETVFLHEVSTPELDDVVRLEDDYGRIE